MTISVVLNSSLRNSFFFFWVKPLGTACLLSTRKLLFRLMLNHLDLRVDITQGFRFLSNGFKANWENEIC